MTTWRGGSKPESIFLTPFPKVSPEWRQPALTEEFAEIIKVRGEASKALEELRKNKTIGASLEAKVKITADGNQFKCLEKYKECLGEYFIVSKVELNKGAFSVQAEKSDGEKCLRCWVYDELTPTAHQYPGVCPKCLKALT